MKIYTDLVKKEKKIIYFCLIIYLLWIIFELWFQSDFELCMFSVHIVHIIFWKNYLKIWIHKSFKRSVFSFTPDIRVYAHYTNMLEHGCYSDLFFPSWFKATVLKKKMYYNMRVKTVKRNLAEIVSKMEIYKSRLLEFPHERMRNLMNCIKEVSLLDGFVVILCWWQLVPENSIKSVLKALSHASNTIFTLYLPCSDSLEFQRRKNPRGCVAIIYEALFKKRR